MKFHLPCWLTAASMVLVSATFLGARSTMTPTNPRHNAEWMRLVDGYFDTVYLRFNPTHGTSAGLHQYDSKLENYSRASLDEEIAALRTYEKKVAAFPAANLNQLDEGDREFLLGTIRSQLLTLETIRPWQKDPDYYSSGITNSAFTIIERDYAPAEIRLAAMIEHKKQMPAALEAARANLVNPPKYSLTLRWSSCQALLGSSRVTFQQHLRGQRSQIARGISCFQCRRHSCVGRLSAMAQGRRTAKVEWGFSYWRSRLFASNCATMRWSTFLSISPSTIAIADLHKNQEQFRQVATELDPSKTPMQVLARCRLITQLRISFLENFRTRSTI